MKMAPGFAVLWLVALEDWGLIGLESVCLDTRSVPESRICPAGPHIDQSVSYWIKPLPHKDSGTIWLPRLSPTDGPNMSQSLGRLHSARTLSSLQLKIPTDPCPGESWLVYLVSVSAVESLA